MDLLLHGNDLSLTDSWVQSVLHLFLKLVLSLPKQDLLFSVDDVNQNVTLLLFQLSDLVLEFDGFVFHLLELLLELHLDVEVVVAEFLLALIVLVDHIVQFVHLEHLVLLGDFQLTDVLVVALYIVVDTDLFLLQNGLLCPQIIVLSSHFRLLFLSLNQCNLICDPVLLHVGRLVVNFFHLLLDVVAMILIRALEVFTVTTTLQLSTLPVQTVDLEGLLLDLEESLLDMLLNRLNILLLFL